MLLERLSLVTVEQSGITSIAGEGVDIRRKIKGEGDLLDFN